MGGGDGSAAAPVDLAQVFVDADSVRLLGYSFCKKKQVVVLGQVDPNAADSVAVGMTEPGDAELIGTLRDFLRRPINPVAMRPADLLRALDVGYGIASAADGVASAVSIDGQVALAPDDPVDMLVADLLARARVERAERIHLVPAAHGLVVRARVDGVLRPFVSPIGNDSADAVIARLCALGGISAEPGAAIERGSFTVRPTTGEREQVAEHVATEVVPVQVVRAPSPRGPEVVVQLSHPRPAAPLDAIGLSGGQLQLVQALLEGTDGLVVVAGPAASGKTTALQAMAGAVGRSPRRVVALANAFAPLSGVDHRVPTSFGGTQADAILGADAIDADVIVVDDLRGNAAWANTVEACERGRLVLASTHALDAVGVVATMDRAALARITASQVLRGVIAPRVLPMPCPACGTGDLPADGGPGCQTCGGSRIAGRRAIYEVLWLTPPLSDRLASGGSLHELRARAAADGMTPLIETARALVATGEVSHEAVRRSLPLGLMQ